jgi:hypothetical protein
MSIPFEELFVLGLLLLGVIGIYYALKLHYIFAFGLVAKTSLSDEKKQKIEKIKKYLFEFLKILLVVGLLFVLFFGLSYLLQGLSLREYLFQLWDKIPEGFWLQLTWTLLRIALLIIVARYLLKLIYRFLEKQELKSIAKNRYNTQNINQVFHQLHNTIKYTFVLGVIYRIIHFFPFLVELSYVALTVLVIFFIVSFGMILKEVFLMYRTRK